VNTAIKHGAFSKDAPLYSQESSFPDIICLNELKAQEKALGNIAGAFPEGTECYFNCSTLKKGYSGTGLLTTLKPLNVQFDLGNKLHDGEGRVITAEFEAFVLVITYVPNAGQKLERLNYRVNKWD